MSSTVWKTAAELALIFETHIRTVRMWERRGHITAVEGRYDLAQVLDWYENRRDARMAALRQKGLAQRDDPCNLKPRRLHTQDTVLSVGSDSIQSVEFSGRNYVANGTAASFASCLDQAPERPPQVYDGIIAAAAQLPPGRAARLGAMYSYLRQLGIDIDQALFDRMVAVEEEAATHRASLPIVRPTTVYYLRVGSLIKIGQTADLASRLRTYPPTAVLLATEIGERDQLESDRLAQFDADKAHRRELFHPSAALIEHINGLREQPLTAADLAA